MLQKLKLVLLSLLMLNITACSHLYGERGMVKDRDYEYLQARSIPPLRVPPGYSDAKIHSNYPVPVKIYPSYAARIDLTPPGLYSTGH